MTETKTSSGKDSLLSVFDKIIKEYEPSKFVQTEWKMQDGLYVQYSAYENNTPCVVGDIHSLSLV
jgi:hypothetical protein